MTVSAASCLLEQRAAVSGRGEPLVVAMALVVAIVVVVFIAIVLVVGLAIAVAGAVLVARACLVATAALVVATARLVVTAGLVATAGPTAGAVLQEGDDHTTLWQCRVEIEQWSGTARRAQCVRAEVCLKDPVTHRLWVQ